MVSQCLHPVEAGCKHYDSIDRLEYSMWIANIGTILLIEFMYLTIVNEISSPIGYTDYVVLLRSIWVANIGTILLIEFLYLTIVNEISSPIGYTNYVV